MSDAQKQGLRLIIGGDKTNTFAIREGETLTIGRDPGCTIQINHHSISPVHCRVAYERGVLTVIDLDSQSGLYYEENRRRRLELKNDISFSIGPIHVAATQVAGPEFLTTAKGKKKVLFASSLPCAPEV